MPSTFLSIGHDRRGDGAGQRQPHGAEAVGDDAGVGLVALVIAADPHLVRTDSRTSSGPSALRTSHSAFWGRMVPLVSSPAWASKSPCMRARISR